MDSSFKTEEAADIFAADIFAGGTATDEPTPEEKERERASLWSANLPSARPAATDWNKLLENLAADFSTDSAAGAAASLSRLLDLPDDAPVEFVFAVKREINEREDFAADNRNSLWLTVGVEGSEAEIYAEIGDAFAAALVGAALGGAVGDSPVRKLTGSERAVVEFLAINLTHEINLILQSPVFKFRALTEEIPASLQQKLDAPHVSLLVCDWQIVHELLPAAVGLYVAPEALLALQPDENRLLSNRLRAAKLRNLTERIENVRMRLSCGAAELSLGELAALGGGDVILLERHNFGVSGANLYGQAEIFLGDGDNARLVGRVGGDDFAFDDAGDEAADDGAILISPLNAKDNWQISIEHLGEIENPVSFEKSMADTEENLTNDAAGDDDGSNQSNGLAIENLGVTLRVELEARRLTVAEIAGLRENQTLELGIRPTDAVNILIDNQTVGRGELVTVEGRLGVRILKLLR